MGTVVRLHLLGGFSLESDGTPVQIASPRLQVLLAFLALQRGKPQRRQALAFALWPDSTDAQAQTNLRTLLSRLHTVLPDLYQLLQIDSRSVGWHPDVALELDVASFEDALGGADAAARCGDGDAADVALERAVGIYSGDLLPDCSDEWLATEREHLRLILLGALEQLVATLEQRREYAAAIVHARRLVHLDPLNEAGYLTLMRLYSLVGSRASALRVYHSCASTLQDELGVTPGAALTAAYALLLASETPRQPDGRVEGGSAPARLVGRDREWQRMLGTWQIAASGRPRLLVLSGVAGIGKTRLAQELLNWASRQGILAATAQCYVAEGDLAFAPVTTWLRSAAMRPGLGRLAPEWLGEVARVTPDLMPGRAAVGTRGALTETWQRQRLFDALARAVLPPGRPILLCIDDLQWCSRDTLDWLHFLLRFDAQARLLVVGTVRTDEVAPGHPLAELLNALRQESRLVEVSLDPLTLEETAALAGLVAHHVLDPTEAARLYAETEGNPLFVVETVQAQLVASAARTVRPVGDIPVRSSPVGAMDVPPGVQAVIAWRLGQVTPTARSLLGIAAVIGRSFTVGLLEQVARVQEDALLAALDEIWQRRIVREHGPDAYDFTHDKLRAVAYAELSPVRRQSLHRRVAEVLEAENAADLDAVAGQLALHYQRAGVPERAAHFYLRAARAARRVYASATAIASYELALALAGAQSQREVAALHDELGEMQHLLGRYDEAEAEWQVALDLIPAGDRVARAHLYRKLGNVSRDRYRYSEALATYDAAEAMLGSVDDSDSDAWWLAWAHVKLERIQTLYWLGQVAETLSLVEQIRPVFEQRGPAHFRARLYQATTMALLRRDRYVVAPETREMAGAYLRAVEEANDVEAVPAAHFLVGFVLVGSDDELDEAEREIEAALALSERTGDVSLESRCLTYLTVVARKRQQVERTQALAERGLRVATAGHMPDYLGAAHGNLAWVAWRLRDRSAALVHGQEAVNAWKRLPASYMFEWLARWPLIGVALEQGTIEDVIEQARALLDARQQRPPSTIEAALVAAVQAADHGDLEAARSHLAAAAAAAPRSGFL